MPISQSDLSYWLGEYVINSFETNFGENVTERPGRLGEPIGVNNSVRVFRLGRGVTKSFAGFELALASVVDVSISAVVDVMCVASFEVGSDFDFLADFLLFFFRAFGFVTGSSFVSLDSDVSSLSSPSCCSVSESTSTMLIVATVCRRFFSFLELFFKAFFFFFNDFSFFSAFVEDDFCAMLLFVGVKGLVFGIADPFVESFSVDAFFDDPMLDKPYL